MAFQGDQAVDLRTFHPGDIAFGRRRARSVPAGVQVAAAPAPRHDVAALLSGSSMRVMEASLAIVAIGTALLLGMGR